MSQLQAFSNSPTEASSAIGTDAMKSQGDSRADSKESVIDPQTGRKTSSVPKMHCFEFNALLQAQRRLLLAEVCAGIAVSGEIPDFAHQSVILEDEALIGAAAHVDIGKVIRENPELQSIEFALARIRDGSYGVCVYCGGEIGRARLKVAPTATRCLRCQTHGTAHLAD